MLRQISDIISRSYQVPRPGPCCQAGATQRDPSSSDGPRQRLGLYELAPAEHSYAELDPVGQDDPKIVPNDAGLWW